MNDQLMEKPDVRVQDEGSLFILHPLTAAATEWMNNNLGEDLQFWGEGIVVEPGYVLNVLQGMVRGGLTIK
jgi:hypothetical protein